MLAPLIRFLFTGSVNTLTGSTPACTSTGSGTVTGGQSLGDLIPFRLIAINPYDIYFRKPAAITGRMSAAVSVSVKMQGKVRESLKDQIAREDREISELLEILELTGEI